MSASTFFRLLKEEDKGDALQRCIADLREGQDNELTHTVRQETFALLPGSPMPYWVSDAIRRKFKELPPFEGGGGVVQRGLYTSDDFRFLRLWWEVSPGAIGMERQWVLFGKGGEYSPLHDDIHLLVNHENNFAEIKSEVLRKYPYLKGNTDWVIHPECSYFQPGLTYPRRTQKGFNVRFLPANCVFGDKGPSIFPLPNGSTWYLLGFLNSKLFQGLLETMMAFGSYETGVVQNIPWISPPMEIRATVSSLSHLSHNLKRDLDRINETSHAFTRPALLGPPVGDFQFQVGNLEPGTGNLEGRFLAWLAVHEAAEVQVIENAYQIDQAVLDLYDISAQDRRTIDRELGPHPGSYPRQDKWTPEDDEELRQLHLVNRTLEEVAHALQIHPASVVARRQALRLGSGQALRRDSGQALRLGSGQALGLYRRDDLAEAVADLISYCVGCLFGRWDIRVGAGEREPPPLPDPEEGLPLYPPGALLPDERPGTKDEAPLVARRAPPQGSFVVDDPGHKQDIVAGVETCLAYLFGEEKLPALRTEIEGVLGRDLRTWLAREFFPFHVKRYSKSRRKAPIYWQLTPASKGYSLWLHYHALGPDTLYTAVQAYAAPKIEFEEGRLKEFRGRFDQAKGSGPAREARRWEKAVEDQERFLQELYTLHSELRRLADGGYDPDLNDGVLINIAPLHRLVPWREAEKMWPELEGGKYAWSTMAKRGVKRET